MQLVLEFCSDFFYDTLKIKNAAGSKCVSG